MIILLMGLILFLGMHSIALFPKFRQQQRDKFGLQRYKAIYSLISLLGFGLIIYGKSQAQFVYVWPALMQLRHLAYLMIYLGFILVVSAHLKGHLKAKLVHPMMLGTALWAIAHLLVNGDLASLLLFGGFAVFSIVYLLYQYSSQTSSASFQPSAKFDLLAFIIGTVVCAIVFKFHGALFSVSLTP